MFDSQRRRQPVALGGGRGTTAELVVGRRLLVEVAFYVAEAPRAIHHRLVASVQLAHQVVEAVAARRGQHTRRQAYGVIDKHAVARRKFARCKHNVATVGGATRLEE